MPTRFSRSGSRLYEPVQILGGPTSRAIVQRPPDIDRPGAEFTHPSLTCRVRHGSLISTGQIVRLQGGSNYLVTNHSETADWVTHHLFRCDRQVTWTRLTTTVDPLTQLPKASSPTSLGEIWVLWEKMRREFTDLSMRIAQENHLMVTGADVQLDDLIDDMRVKRVNRALGVNVVELQG